MNPLADDLDHVLSRTRGPVGGAARRPAVHHRRHGLLRLLAAGELRLGQRPPGSAGRGGGADARRRGLRPQGAAPGGPRRHSSSWLATCATSRSPTAPSRHVIHAATEASVALNTDAPLAMLDVIVQGTRRTLDFARQCGSPKVLLTSSGAVYGRQPPDLTHAPEDYLGAPGRAGPVLGLRRGQARGGTPGRGLPPPATGCR